MSERVQGLLPGITIRDTRFGSRLPLELHDPPHLSDLAAQYLRRSRGPAYPLPDELGPDGKIHFGRGGPYDEHANREQLLGPSEERECEFTLVAKRFCPDLPELQPLLEHVRAVDTVGEQKAILRLGRVIERLWDVFDEGWQFVHWGELVIKASILFERGVTRNGAPVSSAFIIGCIEEAWARAKRGFAYPPPPKVIAYVESLIQEGAAVSFDQLKPFGLPYCAVILWRYLRLRAEKLQRFGVLKVVDPREWLVSWLEDALRGELVYQQRFFEAQPDAARAIFGKITCRGKEALVAVVASDQPRVHSVITERHPEVVLTIVRRSNGQIQFFRRRTYQPVRIKGRMKFLVALIRALEQEKQGLPVSPWDELTAVQGPPGAEDWFFDERTGDVYRGTRTQRVPGHSRLFNQELLERAVMALEDTWGPVLEQFVAGYGGTLREPRAPAAEPEELAVEVSS